VRRIVLAGLSGITGAVLALSPPAVAVGAETGHERGDWVRRIQRFVPQPGAVAPAVVDVPSDFETVRGVRQIGRDQTPPDSGGQRDTTVEPHIAMDPNNPDHLVAVYQQGRFQDGGSVDNGFATSQDGGRTWVSGNLPGVTKAVGGPYDRASDPTAAFGPGGEAYATSLAVSDGGSCPTGVAINRSDDGGLTWNDPVWLQEDGCSTFNDKTWMAVDTFPSSPHFGRIYVTWDQSGSIIRLRWSDDRGETWGPLITPYGPGGYPAGMVVQPDGDVTAQIASGVEVAVTSHDGGQTWDPAVTINTFQGFDPPDIRAGNIWGLGHLAVDRVSGNLYVVWSDARFRSDGLNDIVLSRSVDGGGSWSPLQRVNQDATNSNIDHFTPAVAANSGYVHVVYYRRDNNDGLNQLLRVAYTVSSDDGQTFGPEALLGRGVDLRYAAEVFFDGTKFLGDYIGIAASATTVHPVWSRSFRPPVQRDQHQTTWSARIEK
jgi:hypothetical protein